MSAFVQLMHSGAQQSVDIYRVMKNLKNFPQPIVQAS